MRLSLLLPLLACTGCLFVTDAGELVSETRTVPAFDALEVHDGLNVKVKIGPHQEARLFGHERLLEDLVFYERDGRLVIERETDLFVVTEARADIELTTPSLSRLTASGGSNVSTQGPVEATRFVLEASGGSTVDVPSVEADSLVLGASGGSVVNAVGSTDVATISASGGSALDLGELETRRITVEASGGSTLTLNATEEVVGEASGGSVLTVKGRPPVLDVDLSGGSVVNER